MPELFISSGCSFSAMTYGHNTLTWPHWIDKTLQPVQSIHTGRVGQGNALIGRHIIFQVHQALQKYPANDLLVGIVWSGPWRYDFWQELESSTNDQYNVDVVASGSRNWRILNHHWTDEDSSVFYKKFGSYIGSLVTSYENILRTQWYLQQHQVPYFMSAITEEVLPITQRQHAEIGYLHDMIDFDHFLPISHGLFGWARDQSGLAFADHDPGHLTSEQNQLFTEQIILPFLRERNYV